MPVVNFEVHSCRAFAEGAAFGATGLYTRVDGRLTFAVDPTIEPNNRIVDIELAPRDADGRVSFWSDITLLCPADPAHGNHTLILDVPEPWQRRRLTVI